MPALTIVAHIHAEPDHIGDVKAALQNLVAPTRAEKGCLQYDLHQDNADPGHFMFFENWSSRDTWQDHMNSAISRPMGLLRQARLHGSICLR